MKIRYLVSVAGCCLTGRNRFWYKYCVPLLRRPSCDTDLATCTADRTSPSWKYRRRKKTDIRKQMEAGEEHQTHFSSICFFICLSLYL